MQCILPLYEHAPSEQSSRGGARGAYWSAQSLQGDLFKTRSTEMLSQTHCRYTYIALYYTPSTSIEKRREQDCGETDADDVRCGKIDDQRKTSRLPRFIPARRIWTAVDSAELTAVAEVRMFVIPHHITCEQIRQRIKKNTYTQDEFVSQIDSHNDVSPRQTNEYTYHTKTYEKCFKMLSEFVYII